MSTVVQISNLQQQQKLKKEIIVNYTLYNKVTETRSLFALFTPPYCTNPKAVQTVPILDKFNLISVSNGKKLKFT